MHKMTKKDIFSPGKKLENDPSESSDNAKLNNTKILTGPLRRHCSESMNDG